MSEAISWGRFSKCSRAHARVNIRKFVIEKLTYGFQNGTGREFDPLPVFVRTSQAQPSFVMLKCVLFLVTKIPIKAISQRFPVHN